MASLTFNAFGIIFRLVGVVMLAGVLTSVLLDLQKLAFESKIKGLISMRSINEQLLSKTPRPHKK